MSTRHSDCKTEYKQKYLSQNLLVLETLHLYGGQNTAGTQTLTLISTYHCLYRGPTIQNKSFRTRIHSEKKFFKQIPIVLFTRLPSCLWTRTDVRADQSTADTCLGGHERSARLCTVLRSSVESSDLPQTHSSRFSPMTFPFSNVLHPLTKIKVQNFCTS